MNGKYKVAFRWVLSLIAFVVIFVGVKNSILSINHKQKVLNSLRFIDELDGEELSFSLWKARKEDCYYMVLPSAYQKEDFIAKIVYEDKYYSLYIDEQEIRNGESWEEALQENVHQLRVEDCLGNVRLESQFRILTSKNIPAVLVTVEAKKELLNEIDYANKQYVEKGEMVIIDARGSVVLEDNMERFKVRGNLTSNLSKKPYAFTLSNASSICGMPSSKNWYLLANATDSSHLRNKIMLDWSRELSDRYTPNGEYVDLFVNGEYQGLYLLTETMEIGEDRIDRNPENSIMVEMELDYRAIQETNYLATDREHYWVIHEEFPMSEEEKEAVAVYLNEIESALYAEDGRGTSTGKPLEELLDFDSWTDTWLLKEISSDHDLGTTSQFAIVENWTEKSALKAGPEWDFDGTFGNGMVPWSQNPRNLVAAIWNTKGINSENQNKWLAHMYQNAEFRELLKEKYKEEIQPKIKRLLEYEIDNYAEAIRANATLDSLRWIGNGVYDNFNAPENFELVSDDDYWIKYDVLDVHTDMIKEFLREKDEFLTQLWIEGVEFEVHIEEHNEDGMNLELNNDIYTWIPKVSQ